MESFGKYWEATAPLGNREDNKVLSAGEAARTLEGETMKFSAVLEFETYGKPCLIKIVLTIRLPLQLWVQMLSKR